MVMISQMRKMKMPPETRAMAAMMLKTRPSKNTSRKSILRALTFLRSTLKMRSVH
jgi:hypothetical protein